MFFLNADMLWLLVLIPIFAVFFLWRQQVRERALANIGEPILIGKLMRGNSNNHRRLKSALWVLTLAALIFAIARPAWGVAEEVVQARGLAVIIVLDVSTSMDAQDILPSRLERAKLAAREIFLNSQGDQLGLVLFAGSAFVQFPLTTDVAAAITFLNAASTQSIMRQGTALEDALALAVDTIDERIVSNSVVIVLSDGENHAGDPRLAAELAAARGIIVHTIGYGDTINGSPIPIDTNNPVADPYKTDPQGNLVLTMLEEAILQEIANITGGTYRRANDSGVEIANLVNEIDKIEAGILSNQLQIQQVERFSLFVLLALLALTLEILLPDGRKAQAEGTNAV